MHKDFDWLAKIFYFIIAVIGVPVNLAAMAILCRGNCGLSGCITRYLVAMAATDLLVISTAVIIKQILFHYLSVDFMQLTPVCSVTYPLTRAARDCSVLFTVNFNFDRYDAICCRNLKSKYYTEKVSTVVLATTTILFCFKNIPFYFSYKPGTIIGNVPRWCHKKTSYYIESRWVAFRWFDIVVNPLIPFVLILLLNALTIKHILMASRIRKGLKGENKGKYGSDPEMESRRRSMVLLFTISGSFILLWSVYVMESLFYTISGTNQNYYSDSEYVLNQVSLMLQNLCRCTNTFIYRVTQSKFREEIKSALSSSLGIIMHFVIKQRA